MEKKPRKTKELKEQIINKDIKVQEEAQDLPQLDLKAEYEFIANGNFKTLPKGTVWKITGETALIFLKKGYGKLK